MRMRRPGRTVHAGLRKDIAKRVRSIPNGPMSTRVRSRSERNLATTAHCALVSYDPASTLRLLIAARSCALWWSISSAYRLTPNCTRKSTHCMWPLAAARCSAVLPNWSALSGSPLFFVFVFVFGEEERVTWTPSEESAYLSKLTRGQLVAWAHRNVLQRRPTVPASCRPHPSRSLPSGSLRAAHPAGRPWQHCKGETHLVMLV